ncbi:hypothetical protein BGZ83_006288 [Gryganskiella cystojenkinii]|nr:hypothetical protein BGZ83_006288 [Gryganskiella cystojenkinii]
MADQPASNSFKVMLLEGGDNKVSVIKALGQLTGRGLLESKKLLDEALERAPMAVADYVSFEEAEEARRLLEAAGAKVEIK